MLLLPNIFIAFATACKNHFLSKFSIFYFLIYLFLVVSTAEAGVSGKTITDEPKFQASDLYQALSAEIYNKLGEQSLAVDFYYELSANNHDPAIAKRVTELATVTGQIAKALEGSKRWVELQPDSLEANQYLALLLIRNSYFTHAAQQLDSIRLLIEKTSIQSDSQISSDASDASSYKYTFNINESLTFIGAMLTAETHHEKAYTAFDLFIKQYYSKAKNHKRYAKQQILIRAQLAMKAKKYDEVINELEELSGLDGKNYVDTKVMLAKALHKSGQNKQAIKHLQSIQNHPEAIDSHRLELVRLLVLNKQKNSALPILESLATKHSKNLELLKSLIALQIDQSQLSSVEQNIKILSAASNYKNEVYYFSGEFAEKLGQREKALSNFSKVAAGSYLKNAHKKTINLTKLVLGQKVLNEYFDHKQKSASSIKEQAYWIKLQADDLFEIQQYEVALGLYDKAIRLAPKKSGYRFKRGLVNERIGKFANAETDFNFVLAVHENDFDTLNALGFMLSVHTERLTEAKAYISKAYNLRPNDPLVLDSLGFVLYKTGELVKAEQFLRRAFNLMKKPEVASHLITVLAKLNQHQEAKKIYLQMRKKYPNSPSLKSVSQHLP